MFDSELLKQQHKLYMGNLPTYLTEAELRKIVETIGPIKYLNLVRDYVNDVPVSRVRVSIIQGLLLLGVCRSKSDRKSTF